MSFYNEVDEIAKRYGFFVRRLGGSGRMKSVQYGWDHFVMVLNFSNQKEVHIMQPEDPPRQEGKSFLEEITYSAEEAEFKIIPPIPAKRIISK